MTVEKYYEKLEPDYSVSFPLLDNNTLTKAEEGDDQTLFDFVFELHKVHRYSEFKEGLNKLIKMGVDITSGSLLSSILYLISRRNGTQALNEILEMFRIALFEYDILDTWFDEDEYGTIIDNLKRKVLKGDSGKKIDLTIVDTVREYIFEYILETYNKGKILSLSLPKQHTILLTQFPYFGKVSKLLELGFKFDKDHDYGMWYSDIVDYTIKIGFHKDYGDFYNTKAPNLYELLSLILEYALSEDMDKREVYCNLYKLQDKLSFTELNNLVEKLKVDYSQMQALRYASYGKSDDIGIFADFFDKFGREYKYQNFRQELEKVKDMGVDLHTYYKNADMPYFTIKLACERAKDGDGTVDEILDILKIVLFEYNMNPARSKQCNSELIVTIIDCFSDYEYYEISKNELLELMDKIRKIIFDYSMKLFETNQLNSLPLVQQHNLLLIQLPYFDEVKKLIEVGFKFDNFNTVKYLWEYRISKSSKKHQRIYELLVLMVDNNTYQNKEKITNDIKKFSDHLSVGEMEYLIERVEIEKLS